jgi:hypothetical protein
MRLRSRPLCSLVIATGAITLAILAGLRLIPRSPSDRDRIVPCETNPGPRLHSDDHAKHGLDEGEAKVALLQSTVAAVLSGRSTPEQLIDVLLLVHREMLRLNGDGTLITALCKLSTSSNAPRPARHLALLLLGGWKLQPEIDATHSNMRDEKDEGLLLGLLYSVMMNPVVPLGPNTDAEAERSNGKSRRDFWVHVLGELGEIYDSAFTPASLREGQLELGGALIFSQCLDQPIPPGLNLRCQQLVRAGSCHQVRIAALCLLIKDQNEDSNLDFLRELALASDLPRDLRSIAVSNLCSIQPTGWTGDLITVLTNPSLQRRTQPVSMSASRW